jgi:hypothetical protein
VGGGLARSAAEGVRVSLRLAMPRRQGEHYVANTGPAYPVWFDATGNGGGRRDFSQYGTQFHITASENAQ